MFYMDFYDMFVRFGGVFNAILKDLCSKIRYKIPKIFPPAAGQSTAKIRMNSSAAKEIKIYLLAVFYPPARRRLISPPTFLSGRRILPVLSAERPWHKFVILSGGKPDLLVTLL